MTGDDLAFGARVLASLLSAVYIVIAFYAFGRDQSDRAIFCMAFATLLMVVAQ